MRDEIVASYFPTARHVIGRTIREAGWSAADVDWVIPHNVSRRSWEILMGLVAFPRARLWARQHRARRPHAGGRQLHQPARRARRGRRSRPANGCCSSRTATARTGPPSPWRPDDESSARAYSSPAPLVSSGGASLHRCLRRTSAPIVVARARSGAVAGSRVVARPRRGARDARPWRHHAPRTRTGCASRPPRVGIAGRRHSQRGRHRVLAPARRGAARERRRHAPRPRADRLVPARAHALREHGVRRRSAHGRDRRRRGRERRGLGERLRAVEARGRSARPFAAGSTTRSRARARSCATTCAAR